MTRPNRKYILNYETVITLSEKIIFNEVTLTDFAVIEELLEAFGKSRDRVLELLAKNGIYSYEDYLHEIENTDIGPVRRNQLSKIAATINFYLKGMAAYFDKSEKPKPEIWELKNPENV